MSAFTQDQLDALEQAIALGAKEVRYGDKIVIYNTTAEMLQVRDVMRRTLGQTSAEQKVFPTFSKGF